MKLPARHLAAVLQNTARRLPGRAALWEKRDGRWRSLSWEKVWNSVLATAAILRHAGIREGDRVAIWSENRPEWLFTDMAALAIGAVSVPVYVTLAAPEIEHILKDSGAKALVVSKPALFAKIESALDRLPDLEAVIFVDDGAPAATHAFGKRHYSLKTMLRSHVSSPEETRATLDAIASDRREALATIIYTSGTTGVPKGVMLTHGNFLANIAAVNTAIHLEPSDLHLSFLPLSHVFERLCGYYLAVERGTAVAYAESIDAVPQNMLEIRPTVLMAVPRFYEKIYVKIQTITGRLTGTKKKLFDWARATGESVSTALRSGRKPGLGLSLSYVLAKALVLRKIQRQLGGRVRFCVSGGAALPEPIAVFFHALGILIIEGYGLTETSPVIACNRLDAFRFGTVGKPLRDVAVRIASDGEILTQSPCVMKGYYKLDEATRACIEDGWFHTGDLGQIDADGFLRITGRKKEIIVTSGGKKISTALVESDFEKNPAIQRCVLYGDGRNFLTALIVPNFEYLNRIAAERGLPPAGPAELATAAWVNAEVQKNLDETHRHLAPFEQIKYFRLLDKDFSVDAGELTPTLKIRRSVIFAKYKNHLDAFYAKV